MRISDWSSDVCSSDLERRSTSSTRRTTDMLNTHRTVARAALIPVVGASILLGAGPASAHLSVSASSTAAGSSSILTFSIGHGCDGSATHRIAITLLPELVQVTPTRPPFYSVEKMME